MLYTVGNRESYERGFAEHEAKQERFCKLGMGQVGGKMYRGGLVWQSPEEARAWIEAQRLQAEREIEACPGEWPPKEALKLAQALGVYGLEAEWEKHTMQYDDEAWGMRRLLVNRPLVRLT